MISSRHRFIVTIITTAVTILAANAVAGMLFSSLGKTWGSRGWNYVLALWIILATTGVSAGLAGYLPVEFKLARRTCAVISTALSGAILGFYYGGTASDHNAIIAIISSVALGLIFALLTRQEQIKIAVALISAIAAYGFGFFAGTQGIALISVSSPGGGIWILVCCLYLLMAIANLLAGFRLARFASRERV